METLYTAQEVAKILKMSKTKMYSMIKEGKITYIKIERNVRIRESDLIKWLELRTVQRKLW